MFIHYTPKSSASMMTICGRGVLCKLYLLFRYSFFLLKSGILIESAKVVIEVNE